MTRYLYSLVRCVPDPRTGEFVNIAAIAGDPASGDWQVRQVGNESRVRRLAPPSVISAAHAFLANVGDAIDSEQTLREKGLDGDLGVEWLDSLHADHRNIVQLSRPTPISADNAESALDVVFDHLIIDPVTQPRDIVTKHGVIKALREAYDRPDIDPALVKPRCDLFVGGSLHAGVDFAVANGQALQLTQAWSFQKLGVEEVPVEVKAWGYALQRLQDGESARVISQGNAASGINRDVNLQVVVAEPKTRTQGEAYAEAAQVFSELGAEVHSIGEVRLVANRAAELVAAAAPPRTWPGGMR